jgi:hypothetical protein
LFKSGRVPGKGTGYIYGYVGYTHMGGGIDGATVTLVELTRTDISEDDCRGYYLFKNVPPGLYTLNCQDTNDPISPLVNEPGVAVDSMYMKRVDLDLYPTVTITITGPRATGGIGTQHWTRGCHKYVLQGECSVVAPDVLTIDPGVWVYGSVGTTPTSYLAIQQGAKIIAQGNPCYAAMNEIPEHTMPIVFDSDAGVGSRRGGDWGGLMLFGYSPMNTGCGVAEGNAGEFGCDCGGSGIPPCDEHDSTGVIKYVRIQFAGVELGPGNELNGLAMYGVGDKTLVEYVQVHRNYDDGIEWFGGTNNSKYVLISECYDDHFDWTDGARFKAQFVAVRGYGDSLFGGKWGDRLMECDNQENNFDLLPRSNPTIVNVTLVGGKEVRPSAGPRSNDRNIYFRHGTAGRVFNLINMDATTYGLDVANKSDYAWIPDYANAVWPDGEIVRDTGANCMNIEHCIWYNNTSGHWYSRALTPTLPFAAPELCSPNIPYSNPNNWVVDPELWSPRQPADPDLRPKPGSPALDPSKALPPGDSLYSDPFFTYTDYLGAFDVGNDSLKQVNDWTYPWAAWPHD